MKKKFKPLFRKRKRVRLFFLGFCREIALMINIYKKIKIQTLKIEVKKEEMGIELFSTVSNWIF